jgi:hypothetical protein
VHVLRRHVLLVSRAALRPHNHVVPRHPGAGPRSCATRRRLQHRLQGLLQVVARSSTATVVSTLTSSASLLCCAWSSLSLLLTASRRRLAPFVKRLHVSRCCWHMLVFLWSRWRHALLVGRSSPP